MYSYRITFASKFKKSYKKIKNNKTIKDRLGGVIEFLQQGISLPESFKDHKLKGRLVGYRECHLLPDMLLVYKIYEDDKIIVLSDIGSHSRVF